MKLRQFIRGAGLALLFLTASFSTAHGAFPFSFWKNPKVTSTIFITDLVPTGDSRAGALWVGCQITNTDGLAHVIDQLGRWGVAGNAHVHEVRLIKVAGNVTVASATVTAAGATWVWNNATGTRTTDPSEVYYLASNETAGLENWSDAFVGGTPQARSHTSAFSVDGVIYSADGVSWTFTPIVDAAYGPSNVKYH
jgi:hypothetical protein